MGKRKRVYGVLSWAIEHDQEAGEKLVAGLIATIKGLGGFRTTSENFVGQEAILNAVDAFKGEGFVLSQDGELRAEALDGLGGAELTAALKRYVTRAQRGIEDAALVAGTGKDLLEATAAHVMVEMRGGGYTSRTNFPNLLGLAFTELGLATPGVPVQQGEPAQRRVERAMYELGCAINTLRNKQGTGHGRPWLPTVKSGEAKVALEHMGAIAERLLLALEEAT